MVSENGISRGTHAWNRYDLWRLFFFFLRSQAIFQLSLSTDLPSFAHLPAGKTDRTISHGHDTIGLHDPANPISHRPLRLPRVSVTSQSMPRTFHPNRRNGYNITTGSEDSKTLTMLDILSRSQELDHRLIMGRPKK